MADTFIGDGFSEELTCAVCLDSWKDPVELEPCRHVFCKACSADFKSCPVCRQVIASREPPHRTLVNMALKVQVKCRDCGWTGTREASAYHKCRGAAASAPAPPPANAAPAFSKLFDDFTSCGGNNTSNYSNYNNHNNYSSNTGNNNSSYRPTASSPPQTSANASPSGAFGAPSYPSSNTYATWQPQPQPQPQPQLQQSYSYTAQPSNAYTAPSYPPQPPQQLSGYSPNPDIYQQQLSQQGGYYGQQQQQQQQPQRPPPQAGRRYQVIEPSGSRPWALYGIDQQEYDQIVSLFIFFDSDDSGELDRNEVARLARWLNFARTNSEVNTIFASMDVNGSGSLSLGEFLTWLKYNKPNPESLYGMTQSQYNTIMMQFHSYDGNQDGKLEMEEFCRLVLGLGDVRDVPSAQRLYQRIDSNGDGSIDLHEFLRFRAGRR